MRRWLVRLGALAFGISALALLATVVQIEDPAVPVVDAPQVGPPTVAIAPEIELAESEPEEMEDPLLGYLEGEAARLPDEFLRESEDPFLANWRGKTQQRTSFVYEGPERRHFITVTTSRVDCAQVDRVLRQRDDPAVGRPDRCARWFEKTAEAMERHGVEDMPPREFLQSIGAEPLARVMVIYAGWQRDPELGDEVRLITAEPALVYPQAEFATRDYRARDRVYRAMALGPYARERAVATVD